MLNSRFIEEILDLKIFQPPAQGYTKINNISSSSPVCSILTQSPDKQLLSSRTKLLTLGQVNSTSLDRS